MGRIEPSEVRVLCVDDEPDLAELIGVYLQQEHESITPAAKTSVQDALDYFEAHPVDAIVSDYDMPGTNGLEFLDAIRDVNPALPFILYTGKGSEEIASEAISRGVTDYLQKQNGTDQYSVLANRLLNAVDRYRAEQQVTEERSQFQAVFEQASDAMLIADDDGTLLNVNSAACDLFGRSEEELLGDTAKQFTAEDFDFETAWDSFQRTGEDRGLFPVERPDGTVRVAEYAASTDILPGKHLSVLRDITKQRESERQIYLEKERLSEFAGVLSHDLQNPVQVARTRLDLLANGVDPEKRADHVAAATHAVTRIEHVIDDVLALAQTNESASPAREVALSEVAERVWTRVSRGTAEADIEPDITISANERHVERLLTNLLRNTIEHGSQSVRVRVGRLADGDGFYIEDDGPGIPADEREAVFDWMHSTKEGGTGIGLKSVKQIIDAEGWEISITEGRAGGARFEITGVNGAS